MTLTSFYRTDCKDFSSYQQLFFKNPDKWLNSKSLTVSETTLECCYLE